MKVTCIVGTRPEAIKMAPVVRALRARGVATRVCATGQHRELLVPVLAAFSIEPDVDLGLMTPGQRLTDLASRLFASLGDELRAQRPDWLLAQGDTLSVLVGSLAAYFERIRFGHVEAGLRSGDRWAPFPEEICRRTADSVSDLLFAPTDEARRRLLDEGCPEAAVRVTGNTVVDAVRQI